MKTVELTPREYMTNFCKIAKFSFLTKIWHGNVFVTADVGNLTYLGF